MNQLDEIEVKEIFEIFISKLWLIIPVFIVGCILGVLYSKFLIVPEYSASTTLVLSKPVNSVTNNQVLPESINQNDIILNQKLISTYGEIVKSRKVVGTVIQNLGLNISINDLIKSINVDSVKDTEVMKLTVTTTSAEQSVLIANELAKVFGQLIVQIYNIQNVSIIDMAEISHIPVNVNIIKNTILFGLVALLIICVIIFLRYYFDTTIKTTEDIERSTDLPVLAIIPDVNTFELGGNKNGKK